MVSIEGELQTLCFVGLDLGFQISYPCIILTDCRRGKWKSHTKGQERRSANFSHLHVSELGMEEAPGSLCMSYRVLSLRLLLRVLFVPGLAFHVGESSQKDSSVARERQIVKPSVTTSGVVPGSGTGPSREEQEKSSSGKSSKERGQRKREDTSRELQEGQVMFKGSCLHSGLRRAE